MDFLDLLVQKHEELSNKVMTDDEVDKIAKYVETIGKLHKNDENVERAVECIRQKAYDVQHNFDFSAIDKVSDIADLNRAFNIYELRAQKNGVRYTPTEVKFAEKLCDLSENVGGNAIFSLANKIAESEMLTSDKSEAKGDFAGYVVSAYTNISQKTSLTSNQCRTMLGNVSELAGDTDYPADAFGALNVKLDDKNVALAFLRESEKALNLTEDQEKDVANGSALIKQFSQIVKLHPEMAQECNKLVKKTANLQGGNNCSDCYNEAAQYFEEIQGADGVSFSDKRMAGKERVIFSRRATQAKEREKSNKQAEFSEKYMDFSSEREM